jgi:hypothetical protein
MDRTLRRLGLAIGLSLTLGLLTGSTALAGKPTPPPTPPYATISVDHNCAFTIVGGWTDAFGYADVQVYEDDAFLLTQDTIFGPTPGTIDTSANTVTYTGVRLAKSKTAHTYFVYADFFVSYGSTNLGQVTSNTISAKCA